jgi:acetolactate synthase-1/2/3 large subunit
VLIDIPKDVFTEEVEYHAPGKVDVTSYKFTMKGHPAQIQKAAAMINAAQKPLIIAGRGVIISQAFTELKELAEKAQIPVVTTLLGLGSFPESHVLSYRWLGMHGMAAANLAVNNADVIIAIGMRFDDRATSEVNTFAPNAKIIHIDIDPAEIGKNVSVDVPIVGDVKAVLGPLNKAVDAAQHGQWLHQLDTWRREHPLTTNRQGSAVLPEYVINQLRVATKGEAVIVTGVGQHQMWAAQYYQYNTPNSYISSGGLGTMGFGLPASVGVKMGKPEATVWCVDGDGSFQMTLHELATIVQEKLAVKIAIINNGFLGLPRQWQDLLYGKRFVETPLYGPDFVKLADSYGIPGAKVRRKEEVIPAIDKAMAYDGPFLIDFGIDAEENVYPFVPPGASLEEFLEIPDKKKEEALWQRQNTH